VWVRLQTERLDGRVDGLQRLLLLACGWTNLRRWNSHLRR
jgi:hypothetical protein